ncbi:hypothetical protein CSA37_12205 [Candidatus Fermentibacteria bacterium]|nr:MAG: hypothetical protein CSA37_12205 [Candidatus Fermentibacteria bacterium]
MYGRTGDDRNRHSGLLTSLMVIAVFLIVGAILLFNRNGFVAITRIQSQVDSLRRENESLESRIDSLENTILLLESDSSYMEKRVREILGWGRDNELIIRFTEPKN